MKAILLTLLSLIYFTSTAQHQCGTLPSVSPYHGKAISKSFKKNNISIAVIFHNVTSSFSDEVITTSLLENEIVWVNRFFEESGIQFFMCGAERNIEGLQQYDYTSMRRLDAMHHVTNTLNIYVVDELTTDEDDPICGYAYYPWQGSSLTRHVAIQRSCFDNGKLLAHEFGHFFGLQHTHSTDNGKEYVNGSNCMVAGDGFCDTPADPQLGFNNVRNCQYVGDDRDDLNKTYNPDVSNIMSYAPSRCQNKFSLEQLDFMQFVEQEANSYLRKECEIFPDFKISHNLNAITTRSDQQVDIKLLLEQEDLNINQDVEVEFSFNSEGKKIVIGSYILNMEPGIESFEEEFRLTLPLNTSSRLYFVTAEIDPERKVLESYKDNNQTSFSLRVNNSDLEDQVLYPNPASDKVRLFLRESSISQNIDIAIYDYYGQLVYAQPFSKNGTELFIDLDISFLDPGLYVLHSSVPNQMKSNSFKFVKLN